jgi:large subunit ribosomal protein L18Ae
MGKPDSIKSLIKQFQIVGRAAPTPKKPTPKIYRIKIFAKNKTLARSKFWYFMNFMNKAKRGGGEILAMNEIHDKRPTSVNNYAVWLRYESRTDTHNMYKEYRDVTINGAMAQMYSEMAGRHRAAPGSIQIIKTAIVKDADCRRNHVLQMHGAKLRFPTVRKMPLVQKKLRSTFNAKRPTTFMQ